MSYLSITVQLITHLAQAQSSSSSISMSKLVSSPSSSSCLYAGGSKLAIIFDSVMAGEALGLGAYRHSPA